MEHTVVLQTTRRRLLVPLAASVAAILALGFAMLSLQPLLNPTASADLPGPVGWLLTDLTEAQFAATALAGVGMIAGALLAHRLARRRSRLRGFDVAYGTGLLPWVLAASLLGLLLSELVWGWDGAEAWQPTFVPFVSVPAAVVLVHGRGWRVALTGAVAGALTTTPIAMLVVDFVCIPLGIPNVVGNVTGMWAGAAVVFGLWRFLPWTRRAGDVADEPAGPVDEEDAGPARLTGWWLPRRALAEFSEPQFFGNELASLGFLAGLLIAWLIAPASPAYGTLLVPQLLTAQLLAAVLGAWWHARRWEAHGWYPSFVPVVSLVPAAVLAFDGHPVAVGIAIAIGVLLGPPLAHAIIRRLPAGWHPFVGSVFAMTAITLLGFGVLHLAEPFILH